MCAAPVIHISTPLSEATARGLKVGDAVRINGTIIAARDAAHKRLVETMDKGEPLPVDLHGAVVYYVGPSPAKPGEVIGAAGPTTSGRMDAYTRDHRAGGHLSGHQKLRRQRSGGTVSLR